MRNSAALKFDVQVTDKALAEGSPMCYDGYER